MFFYKACRFMPCTAQNYLLAKKKKTPHRRVRLMQITVIGEFRSPVLETRG